MKHDYSKLEEALQYIKDVCKSKAYCYECPMGRGDLCRLSYNDPQYWDIKNILYNKESAESKFEKL